LLGIPEGARNNNLSWQLFVDNYSKVLNLEMDKGEKINKNLILLNNNNTGQLITLECIDIENSICNYVVLEKYTTTLSSNIETFNSMYMIIEFPPTSTTKSFTFEIIGTNEFGISSSVVINVNKIDYTVWLKKKTFFIPNWLVILLGGGLFLSMLGGGFMLLKK